MIRRNDPRAKTVAEYIEATYPNVSKSMKEQLAKTMYDGLSNGAVTEIENKLSEE